MKHSWSNCWHFLKQSGGYKMPTKRIPDYSNKTLADLSLAESEALFSSIGEGVIVTDSKGRISRVNQCALEILRCKESDLMHKWFPEVIVAENEQGEAIPNIDRPILEAFLGGKPVFKRLYYRCLDGTRVAVALTASPVLLNQRPIGAIEVFRDITEEVKLERSKDEFIALASHQLRTPATSVKQFAGMLLADFAGPLSDEQKTMVKKVYDNNERQLNIVNDLLRVAQIDAGKVELLFSDILLSELLEDVVEEYSQKFQEKSQEVELVVPPKPIVASLDYERFRMALENIVDNATKYTEEHKKICIELCESMNKIYISIKDQGVGIAPEDTTRIFEKFSRLDNPLSIKVGGTGLGLYWAEKIINLHGAKIEIKSTVGAGTEFIIELKKELPHGK